MQSLYSEVLDVAPDQRESFLQRRTEGNTELYDSVKTLLRTETHPALNDLAINTFSDVFDRLQPGDQIDRYQLVARIGEGGMGVVYKAQRADGVYTQTVALKLVKPGMDSEGVVMRFRAERQILAGLQHPSITRLLDGGVYKGSPYLIVEYFDGVPLTDYCNLKEASIASRLSVFEMVCEAVAFAHQNLVVHRDLKPSNILVGTGEDGRPVVKLLDFGIAKVLKGDGVNLNQTQTGDRMLTPAYAAPEQIKGERITTATDVYGLGVVLYELLTGEKPFDIAGKGLFEIEQTVIATDPDPPSTRVTQSHARQTGMESEVQLQRKIRGDLDAIVLKALRKEPDARYVSAAEFMADLRRHLESRAVLARQGRTGYRLQKFVHRNRLALGLSATFLILFLVIVTAAFVQISNERDQVAQEANKAKEVAAYLQGIFSASITSDQVGGNITARELLDQGARRIESELSEQPVVMAQMQHVIGEAYQSVGMYEAADTLLQKALDTRRGMIPQDTDELRQSLDALGRLYERISEYEKALVVLDESVALPPARSEAGQEALASTYHSLAHVQFRLRKLEESEQNIRKAIAIKESLYPDGHLSIAYTLNILGLILKHLEQDAEALQVLQETLEIREQFLGDIHVDVAVSRHNLASYYKDTGAFEEAEPLYRKAIATWREVPGAEDQEIANSMSHLAFVVNALGRHREAESIHREALDMIRRIFGDNHVRTGFFLTALGVTLGDAGRYEEAEEVTREALRIISNYFDDEHARLISVHAYLGTYLFKQGRYAEAKNMITDAFSRCEAIGTYNKVCRVVARPAMQQLTAALGDAKG